MTRVKSGLMRTAFLTVLACPPSIMAAPLRPEDFASLGTLITGVADVVIIDTTAGTMTVNGVIHLGTIHLQDSAFRPEVAVFRFDDVDLAAGTALAVTGHRPLAVLSGGNLRFGATLSVNGGDGGSRVEGVAVAGGGFTGSGGPGTGGSGFGQAGAGGGFGGRGGDSDIRITLALSGGPAHRDLRAAPEGGGPGGPAPFPNHGTSAERRVGHECSTLWTPYQ